MRLQAVMTAFAKGTAMAVLATCCLLQAQSGNTLLKPAEIEKLFPATVYYDGQSAPAQLRNSGGVSFPMVTTYWQASSTQAATPRLWRPSIKAI